MPRSVLVWGSFIIIFMVLAFGELMAYLASRVLAQKGLVLYSPHITETYEHYLARLNPSTGWPSPGITSQKRDFYDSSGSRRTPAFPDPSRTPACVSLYGDSFIEAFGVDHEHAWSNVLSRLLKCRVANYGVAGYGTDQAFLRFRDNLDDPAGVVILGFLSENIHRNVNQLRNLLAPETVCQLKPRFILDDQGQLTLVPIPSLSDKEYDELRQNPELVLSHDYYAPGGVSGLEKARFPYLWRIMNISNILFKRLVLFVHPYQEFLQPGHPSKALAVTVAIMEEFCRTARNRGKQPLILVIPTFPDFFSYHRDKRWVYQPLIDRLKERRLDFIDAGPKILQYLGGSDPKTLYAPKNQYHFNEEGNRLLAKIVYDFLSKKKLLDRRKTGLVQADQPGSPGGDF